MEVKISQLSKTYPGGIQALRGVNLEIGTGTFGILGSKGAGKTTLLRILATLLKPSQGRVRFRGSPFTLVREAEGRVWELEIPNDQEPYPEWQIASRVQGDDRQKLRLVGASPGGSARPVMPTLEVAYLVLMGGEKPFIT